MKPRKSKNASSSDDFLVSLKHICEELDIKIEEYIPPPVKEQASKPEYQITLFDENEVV